ncbi:MAG: hypothetical protein P8Y91_10060 [Desulfuromonadales bacterium]
MPRGTKCRAEQDKKAEALLQLRAGHQAGIVLASPEKKQDTPQSKLDKKFIPLQIFEVIFHPIQKEKAAVLQNAEASGITHQVSIWLQSKHIRPEH